MERASPAPGGLVSGPRHKRAGSEPYYEDVDPRFAVEEPSDDGYQRDSGLPNALTPGGHVIARNGTASPEALAETMPGNFPRTPANAQQAGYFPNRMPPPSHEPGRLHPHTSYTGANDGNSSGSAGESPLEHSQDGSGSERVSEASHFTSISERPINPNWRPDGSLSPQPRRGPPPQQRRAEDVVLATNPDFSIPGVGVGRRRAGSGRDMAASNMGGGMTGGGRYPEPI